MPNQPFTLEIRNHIKHNDHSLTMRRTLDLCLDTGNNDLIRSAIQLNRLFGKNAGHVEGASGTSRWKQAAEKILDQVDGLELVLHPEKRCLLQADHLSKKYTKGPFSLKPISLEIHAGEILGVVGENGNGKTTLLRCLSGQLSCDTGELNYPLLNRPDYYAIKNHIAFIPQRIPKWYGLLKDNLHFSAAIAGIHGERNDLMVDFMLERLNLTQYAHLTWNQISSGYRTKFEIARILLQQPKLLILDEPLANLDINAQQTILTDLGFMANGMHHSMGIILSSQQLHEVEKVASQVMFIRDGVCVFNSTEESGTAQSRFIIELETPSERERITQVFGAGEVEIQYNGGFYTLQSQSLTASQLILAVIQAEITVTYFRDITHSSKRFFNN